MGIVVGAIPFRHPDHHPTLEDPMASLDLSQLEVVSFDTASEREAVSLTDTNGDPDSPLCGPTAAGSGCDTVTNPV
jgi:hypothetical protein